MSSNSVRIEDRSNSASDMPHQDQDASKQTKIKIEPGEAEEMTNPTFNLEDFLKSGDLKQMEFLMLLEHNSRTTELQLSWRDQIRRFLKAVLDISRLTFNGALSCARESDVIEKGTEKKGDTPEKTKKEKPASQAKDPETIESVSSEKLDMEAIKSLYRIVERWEMWKMNCNFKKTSSFTSEEAVSITSHVMSSPVVLNQDANRNVDVPKSKALKTPQKEKEEASQKDKEEMKRGEAEEKTNQTFNMEDFLKSGYFKQMQFLMLVDHTRKVAKLQLSWSDQLQRFLIAVVVFSRIAFQSSVSSATENDAIEKESEKKGDTPEKNQKEKPASQTKDSKMEECMTSEEIDLMAIESLHRILERWGSQKIQFYFEKTLSFTYVKTEDAVSSSSVSKVDTLKSKKSSAEEKKSTTKANDASTIITTTTKISKPVVPRTPSPPIENCRDTLSSYVPTVNIARPRASSPPRNYMPSIVNYVPTYVPTFNIAVPQVSSPPQSYIPSSKPTPEVSWKPSQPSAQSSGSSDSVYVREHYRQGHHVQAHYRGDTYVSAHYRQGHTVSGHFRRK